MRRRAVDVSESGTKRRSGTVNCGSVPKSREMYVKSLVSLTAAASLVLGSGMAHADVIAEGSFKQNCAGCHAAGGNVVQAGATLFPADLERNGVNDAETIYALIYKGKNKMPGYGVGCAPRGQCTFGARMSDDDVRGLAEYVLEQSQHGWK